MIHFFPMAPRSSDNQKFIFLLDVSAKGEDTAQNYRLFPYPPTPTAPHISPYWQTRSTAPGFVFPCLRDDLIEEAGREAGL